MTVERERRGITRIGGVMKRLQSSRAAREMMGSSRLQAASCNGVQEGAKHGACRCNGLQAHAATPAVVRCARELTGVRRDQPRPGFGSSRDLHSARRTASLHTKEAR
jgi:hypothetical protein